MILLLLTLVIGLSFIVPLTISDVVSAADCPSGQKRGDSNDINGATDPNYCYQCTSTVNPGPPQTATINCTQKGKVQQQQQGPPPNVHNGVFVPTATTPGARADEYCKYKYSNTAEQNACKDGYNNGDPDKQTCPKYNNQPNGAALARACSDGWSQGVAAGDNKNKHEATQDAPPGGQQVPGSISGTGQKGGNKSCSAVKTGILECADNLGMAGPLAAFIRVLSVCAGIVAVAGLAWGGFRYASAGGNADQAQQGMSIIRNTIIGMVIFVSMVAIANFIVPGTLFG